jgi:uncharacterized membrane protein YkvA (DUF1232 family)
MRHNVDMANETGLVRRWKRFALGLKAETYALYLAVRDPRTPWYARALAACVVAYALSPIDLIPDPIPILGYLDDFVLVPIGIGLVLRLIPPEVMAECRATAAKHLEWVKPKVYAAAVVIVAIWIVILVVLARYVIGLFVPAK